MPSTRGINVHQPSGWCMYSKFAYGQELDCVRQHRGISSNVLYPRAFFLQKSATGGLVHHYSYLSAQFVENNTLDQFVENNNLDQFVENNTLDQFVENNNLDQFVENKTLDQFVENNTLDQFVENYTLDQFVENHTFWSNLLAWGGTRAFFHILIPLHGVSKQLRQRKLARSKRSFSEVLTACKMSRGWKLLSELRNSGLAGRVALATMD